jgi:uncharacterized protein (TIGR02996 family)
VIEDQLLGAVLAAPDDDNPRRIMADWLLDQPDPASQRWGELIQLQCDGGPARARRAAALLGAHERELWARALAPVPEALELPVSWRFERGFIIGPRARVYGAPLGPLLRILPRLAEATPLVELDVHVENQSDWVEFLSWPGIARLRSLDMDSFEKSGEVLAPLKGAPLQGLRDLGLRIGYVRPADFAPLAEAPLSGLRDLHLSSDGVDGNVVALLSKTPWFRGLDFVSLQAGEIGDGLPALARTPFKRLTGLGVSSGGIRDEDLAPLANAPALARLDKLSVFAHFGYTEEISWSTRAIARLVAAFPALRTLRLGGTVEADALPDLIDREAIRKLTSLELAWARLGDLGVGMIADAYRLEGLHTLRLSNVGMTNEGAARLATSPHLTGLRELDLRENDEVDDEGILALIESPNLQKLERLDVNRCRVQRPELVARLRERFGPSVFSLAPSDP